MVGEEENIKQKIKITEIGGLKLTDIAGLSNLNKMISDAVGPVKEALKSMRTPEPSISAYLLKSPHAIREENEWERHNRLMKLQGEIVDRQNRLLKEQAETTRLTRLILFLTLLGVAFALVALYLASRAG